MKKSVKYRNLASELNYNSALNFSAGKYTCTPQQTEILTACMMGGDDANRSFNQSVTLHFTGVLHYEAMEIALRELVKQNEALRLQFDVYSNTFQVNAQPEFRLNRVHYGPESASPDEILKHGLFEHAQHVFDLKRGPLFKFTLLSDDVQRHDLILTFHHVVCDGWSLGLVCKKLGKLYSSLRDGLLPEDGREISFSAYARDENAFVSGDEFKEELNYWQQELDHYIPAPVLPYRQGNTIRSGYRCSTLSVDMDPALFKRIQKMASDKGSSLFITLSAIFNTTLFAANRTELVCGIPAAGQNREGLQELIGHCVSLLPVRSRFQEGMTFAGYLEEYKKDFKNAILHKRASYGSILRVLKQRKNFNEIPLIPFTFNVDRALTDEASFAGLDFSLSVNPRYYSVFDMVMNLSRNGDEIVIQCLYNDNLFEKRTIEKLLGEYIESAERFVNDADAPVLSDRQPASAENEDQDGIETYTFHDFVPVYKLIENAVNLYSDKEAVLFRGEKLTYQELNRKANILAHMLLDQGLKKGDVVAIILDRSPLAIISILAILKAGGAYLPVDTDYPEGRINYMLKDSACAFFITADALSGRYQCQGREVIVREDFDQTGDLKDSNPDLSVLPEDSAYIIYTSGSTGLPKGVVLEHGNLHYFLQNVSRVPGLDNNDRLLALTSLSFDISILEVFLPYVHGATAVLLDKYERRDPDTVIRHLEQSDITVMFATPTHWKMIVDAGWKTRVSGLKAISGGEPLKSELAAKILPLCGSLWNVYGPTETSVFSNIKRVENAYGAITIGKTLPGTNIYIMDEAMRRLGKGREGEIYIAGPGVGRGYLNKPELSSEKFLKDPFSGENRRMYRTGDMGIELENGEYQCLGRLDQQIKIRGYRVEAGEIETTLNSSDDIQESLVRVLQTASGNDLLLGYVKLSESGKNKLKILPGDYNSGLLRSDHPLAKEWRKHIAGFLPEYMIPAVFIIIGEWPVSPNGKIDKLALPVPELKEPENGQMSELSISEFKLAQIWENALGVSSVKRDDNFFDLGGHSLAAIRVVNDIEQTFGVRLPISSLFETPVLSDLCRLLEGSESSRKWKCLVPVKPQGSKKALYMVHGGGLGVMLFRNFTPYLDENQPVFGIQGHGMIKGEMVPETIEEMARLYNEEIIMHDPAGPYHLSGFSAGSVIAFEMARQLTASGRKVASVIMLDYSLESLPRVIPFREKLKRKLLEAVPRMLYFLMNLFRFPGKAIHYQLKIIGLTIWGGLRKIGIDYEKIFPDKEEIGKEHIFHAMDVLNHALSVYEPSVYKGKLDLIRSKVKPYYLRDPRYLGWKKYAGGGIEICEVEGEHDDIFMPPHSHDFALKLQGILDRNNLHYTQYESNTYPNTPS